MMVPTDGSDAALRKRTPSFALRWAAGAAWLLIALAVLPAPAAADGQPWAEALRCQTG